MDSKILRAAVQLEANGIKALLKHGDEGSYDRAKYKIIKNVQNTFTNIVLKLNDMDPSDKPLKKHAT